MEILEQYPDVKCSYCGELIEPRPLRVNKVSFCSGKHRVAYHRLEKQITTQYHIALKAINYIGQAMIIRDDLTLQGDDLMMQLKNKMYEYQFDKLSTKINKLQHEKRRNQQDS